MSYGVRTWDANGVLQLDVDSRQIKKIATVTFPFNHANGKFQTLAYPGIKADGNWAVYTNAGPWLGVATIKEDGIIGIWIPDTTIASITIFIAKI